MEAKNPENEVLHLAQPNKDSFLDESLIPSKEKKSCIQRFNSFMLGNYLIITIITFSLVFVLVPFVLFQFKRIRYHHIFRANSDDVVQPLNIARNFRWIQLDNEIDAIVVSDPELNHAGAALEIDVGSSYDPKDIPGLAHFLEHMLFMGSKKYANYSYFKDFISFHGGRTNAFTSDDYTKFYFTINNERLADGLEIFSHFFIDPLFDPNRIEKELLAVHNEYEMNLQKNIWRFFELLRISSNPNHSFHRFTCGNLKTLKISLEKKGLKIQDEVVKFFKKYYSSHKMKLVLIGNHPLDSLEKMVFDTFSQVQNTKKNYEIPNHFINSSDPYPQESLGKFIWYKTIGQQNILSVVFPLDLTKNFDFKVNPIDYINHLIKYEGKNSLKNDLLKKEWITDLETTIIQKSSDFLHLIIKISLSDKGVSNVLEVLKGIFSWIDLLKIKGVDKDLYEKFSSFSYLNFFYSKRNSLEEDLLGLTASLRSLSNKEMAFKNFLLHKEVLMKYNATIIKNYLEKLNVENSLILFGSNDYEISNIFYSEKIKNDQSTNNSYEKNFDFKESDDFFDFDTDIFENLKIPYSKKKGNKEFKKFYLKPIKKEKNTEFVFKEAITENSEYHFNFDEIMQETSTYCDLEQTADTNNYKITSGYLEPEFSFGTSMLFSNSEDLVSLGRPIKCYSDTNNSLFNYEKLNSFDETMKIYYASEKINQTLLNELNQYNLSLYENFTFLISDEYFPRNFKIKSNCSDGKQMHTNNNNNNKNKEEFLYDTKKKCPTLISGNENKMTFFLSESDQYQSECLLYEIQNDQKTEYPQKIIQNKQENVWMKTERSLFSPKINARIYLKFQQIDFKDEKILLEVLADILNRKYKEMYYEAYLMKYKTKVLPRDKGLEFQLEGFSDKYFSFVEDIFKNLRSIFNGIKTEEFELYISDLRSYYESMKKAQSLQQLKNALQKTVLKDFFSFDDTLENLNKITLPQTIKFIEKSFDNIDITILMVGNILIDEGIEISNNITMNIIQNQTQNSSISIIDESTFILNITEEHNSVIYMNNSNRLDENNAIINYYQIGERNDQDYVKNVVISTLLNSQCFNYLRTEKQLGYIVSSNLFSLYDIDGFTISIQGSNHSPYLMNKYIEEFLFYFYDFLSNQTDSEYKTIFHEIGQNFVAKQKDLDDLSENLWEEIFSRKNDFKKNFRYRKIIKNLTKSDILDAFQNIFKFHNKKICFQLHRDNTNLSSLKLLNSNETYSGKKEKFIQMNETKKWDYFTKIRQEK